MTAKKNDKRAVCRICKATVGVIWRDGEPLYRRHPRGAPNGQACSAFYGMTVNTEDFLDADDA